MKKLIALILAGCFVLPFAACNNAVNPNPDNPQGKYDVPGENKTQINFTVYGGALDGEWADIICEEFAKEYSEYYFGGGSKKGVYFNKNRTYNTSPETVGTTDQHIVTAYTTNIKNTLSNSSSYYNLKDLVTDDNREGGSIENNLFPMTKDQVRSYNGDYYALPYFEYFNGIQYNRNVFSEQKALFADESDTSAQSFKSKFSNKTYKLTNDNGILAKGPDGVAGTVDDGLPSSVEEFLVMMDYFKRRTNYWPITVSGACILYVESLVQGMIAALAGQKEMENYYNSTGEIEVIDRDSNGNIVYETDGHGNRLPLFESIDYISKPKIKTITLTPENGYLASDLAARFYAYAILEIMQKENFFSPETTDGGISHYDAQLQLMVGNRIARYSNAAMLVEYTYWWNESVNAGNVDQAKLVGISRENIDVRPMSLPTKFYSDSEEVLETPSLLRVHGFYYFVSEKINLAPDVKEAVLAFTKYFYSEKTLKKITKISGYPLSLKYELSEQDLREMDNYTRILWGMRRTDGSNVIMESDTRLNHDLLRLGKFMGYEKAVAPYSAIKTYGAAELFVKNSINKSLWRTSASN